MKKKKESEKPQQIPGLVLYISVVFFSLIIRVSLGSGLAKKTGFPDL